MGGKIEWDNEKPLEGGTGRIQQKKESIKDYRSATNLDRLGCQVGGVEGEEV